MARVGQQAAGLNGDPLPGRISLGVLTRVFPPGLVDQVVAAAGVGERRVRVLPARMVVYYNLAMVVFFQSGYAQVWFKLLGGLDRSTGFQGRVTAGTSPSPAAISKARARLGWKVMAELLDAVAGPLAGEPDEWAHVAGLRLVAFARLAMDVPDTSANAEAFGRPGGDVSTGVLPQVRVVVLADCGSRAVMGARCAEVTTGEQRPAGDLLPLLGAGMLAVADRGFLSPAALAQALATGAHVLWRPEADSDLPILRVLPDGTYLSRVTAPATSPWVSPEGMTGGDVPGITVRVVEYSVGADDDSHVSELFRLVTDLLDPADLSAADAATAYAQRRRIETAFAEFETGVRGGATLVLRSRSPDMIRQELYALLCVYQAIRTLICPAPDTGHPDDAPLTHEPRPSSGA